MKWKVKEPTSRNIWTCGSSKGDVCYFTPGLDQYEYFLHIDLGNNVSLSLPTTNNCYFFFTNDVMISHSFKMMSKNSFVCLTRRCKTQRYLIYNDSKQRGAAHSRILWVKYFKQSNKESKCSQILEPILGSAYTAVWFHLHCIVLRTLTPASCVICCGLMVGDTCHFTFNLT